MGALVLKRFICHRLWLDEELKLKNQSTPPA